MLAFQGTIAVLGSREMRKITFFNNISKTKLVLHEFIKTMSVYYILWSLIVCVVQNWYKYRLGLWVAQLETISVFQQTQVNITFFTNYSTVLLTFATAAFVTVCYWPMTYSVVTYIMTRNGNSCFFPPLICNISFPFCLSTSGTAGNSLVCFY